MAPKAFSRCRATLANILLLIVSPKMFTFAHNWVLIPEVGRRLRIGGFIGRLELYGDELCRLGAGVRQFDRVAGEDFYFLHAEFDVLGRHAFPFPLEL